MGADADEDGRCQGFREEVEMGLTGCGDSLDVKGQERSG